MPSSWAHGRRRQLQGSCSRGGHSSRSREVSLPQASGPADKHLDFNAACGQMASGGNGFMTSLNMWQVFSKKLLLDDIADDKSVLSHKPEVLETFCKTECVPEDLELKQQLFAQLDGIMDDDVVLSSSSSCLLPSKLFAGLAHRKQCLVAHPVNPPYYVPLVELVPHPETAPATVDRTHALMRKIGQSPVRIMKEIDGFALNRLQYAIISEAWRLVEEGVVSPGDLDLVMSEGLGMRYAFIGPLETMHLNAEGMLSYCDRYSEGMRRVLKTFGPIPEFSGAAAEKVHQTSCVLFRKALKPPDTCVLKSPLGSPSPDSPACWDLTRTDLHVAASRWDPGISLHPCHVLRVRVTEDERRGVTLLLWLSLYSSCFLGRPSFASRGCGSSEPSPPSSVQYGLVLPDPSVALHLALDGGPREGMVREGLPLSCARKLLVVLL
ncbi:hypothetical protein CB1_000273055 [Camelus ferus]|nr:hypothetical protein CB1_000273055 [Camelus ferus]